MSNYFQLASKNLQIRLSQIQFFIKKHNPTIGILTEEIVRDFLKNHLPSMVNVEQGFIQYSSGKISRQCDIIIFDSQSFSPIFRANNIVIVPIESVVALIEVKTTINKGIFHDVIDYFKTFEWLPNVKTYLFIFNSGKCNQIGRHFKSYEHVGDYKSFDHDIFQMLPDEITGINESYHFKKDLVVTDRDCFGYSSWFYDDAEGSEINALQLFFESINSHVYSYIEKTYKNSKYSRKIKKDPRKLKSISAIQLFDM